MKQRIFLSKDDTANILATYADHGMKCLPDLSTQYGISRGYIRSLALAHQTKVKKPHGGGYRTDKDKRWEWAKARGAILA